MDRRYSDKGDRAEPVTRLLHAIDNTGKRRSTFLARYALLSEGVYSYRSAFTGSATAARYACTLTVITVTSRVISSAAA